MKNRSLWGAIIGVSFVAVAVFGFLGLSFAGGFTECAAVVTGNSCGATSSHSYQLAEIFLSFSQVILTAGALLMVAVFFAWFVGAWPGYFSWSPFSSNHASVLHNSRSSYRKQFDWLVLTDHAGYGA